MRTGAEARYLLDQASIFLCLSLHDFVSAPLRFGTLHCKTFAKLLEKMPDLHNLRVPSIGRIRMCRSSNHPAYQEKQQGGPRHSSSSMPWRRTSCQTSRLPQACSATPLGFPPSSTFLELHPQNSKDSSLVPHPLHQRCPVCISGA